jgi:hypothetical protein
MIAAGTGAEWPSHAAKERARNLLSGWSTTRRSGSGRRRCSSTVYPGTRSQAGPKGRCRPSLRRLPRLRTAPPRTAGQHLGRTRARGGLPGRRHFAHGKSPHAARRRPPRRRPPDGLARPAARVSRDAETAAHDLTVSPDDRQVGDLDGVAPDRRLSLTFAGSGAGYGCPPRELPDGGASRGA